MAAPVAAPRPSASSAKNPGKVRPSQGMRASENRRQLPGPAKPFTWAQIHASGIDRPQSFSR